jgi:hypothetical protein
MRYVCDAPRGKDGNDRTWFQLETEGEAFAESEQMGHAVGKHFTRAREAAAATYKPLTDVFIEQDIGLNDHIARTMPRFLTLRDMDGRGLATAMLPPAGKDGAGFRIIIVGPRNADPYPEQGDAIAALGTHAGLTLERSRCFPY